jgi:MFS family permease
MSTPGQPNPPKPPIPLLSGRAVALQHRDFRLVWFAQIATIVGLQMQTIAVNWHIYTLLRDAPSTLSIFGIPLAIGALGLGGLGLMRWLPLLPFGIIGGLLADTRNRRHLLIATQLVGALIAATLAGLAFTENVTVLALYAVVAALTALSAIESPAREAMIPNLVPRHHLTNAVSLFMMTNVIGTITGPALSAYLLGTSPIGVIYALHALLFVPALVALSMLHYSGAVAQRQSRINIAYLLDGFRFTFSTHMIRSSMLLDFFATMLGSARTLLPIVADQVLGVGGSGYGVLATAQPLGSLIAGTIASARRDILRQGAILLICVAIYGLGTAFFGLSTLFPLSYAIFTTTGAADTISSIIRGTIRQMWTPDVLRGRMLGVNMIFSMGGPQLGEVRAGLVAAAVGAPLAIITGGIAAALVALFFAWRDPTLRHYTSDRGYAAVTAEPTSATTPAATPSVSAD